MKRTVLERLELLEKRVAMYLESKKDLDDLRKYLGDDLYNKYMKIRDRIPKNMQTYKDFQSIKKLPLHEIENFVNNFKSNTDLRSKSKQGAELLYEDPNWKVYKITTYDASKYYGKGTKWCISGNYQGHEDRGEFYFNDYIDKENLDGGYYFYINKHDPSEKYCVLQKKSGNIDSIWDASDTDLGNFSYDRPVDLPNVPGINLYKYSIDDLTLAMDYDDFDKAIEIIKESPGMNFNKWDLDNRTALDVATLLERYDIVKLLLKNGADPDKKSGNGLSPLLNAAIWEDYDMVKLLLENGADPNVSDDKHKHTPLYISAKRGNLDIIKLLVKYGANINSLDYLGMYPLDVAISEHNNDVVDYLQSMEAKSRTYDFKK